MQLEQLGRVLFGAWRLGKNNWHKVNVNCHLRHQLALVLYCNLNGLQQSQQRRQENNVTIDELACLHPYLFHVTTPGAWASIRQHGLLSTKRLLVLFEVEADLQQKLQTSRRATAVPLHHAQHGDVVLNDNQPLTEKALSHCLDDGLTPGQWLTMLNERVFFWPDEAG